MTFTVLQYDPKTETTGSRKHTIDNIERDSDEYVTMYAKAEEGEVVHYFVLHQSVIDILKTI
jgi:hypothetical protein